MTCIHVLTEKTNCICLCSLDPVHITVYVYTLACRSEWRMHCSRLQSSLRLKWPKVRWTSHSWLVYMYWQKRLTASVSNSFLGSQRISLSMHHNEADKKIWIRSPTCPFIISPHESDRIDGEGILVNLGRYLDQNNNNSLLEMFSNQCVYYSMIIPID